VHLPSARTLNDSLFVTVIFGAVWGSGRLVRSMAAQRHQLTVALEELAREQAAREETAVQAERARIGMEMHDVVAHAVSLMVLQVGAARLALEKDALTAPDQLRAAEHTGRAALDEMRRSLMLIREGKDRGALLPLPGLDGLQALVDGFRPAGLDIELCTDVAEGLPASLQLSAYRVLQEALTNVLKHAGPVPVRASVRSEAGQVVVEVTNGRGGRDGAGMPGGNGLAGMRERVALFGGRLDAGPADGGFAVCARLPVPPEAAR
jgi:signal transduction histidine kinase